MYSKCTGIGNGNILIKFQISYFTNGLNDISRSDQPLVIGTRVLDLRICNQKYTEFPTTCKRFQISKLVGIQRFHKISGSLYEISSELRCHGDICFPGMHVSHTHIPRAACFPAHISLIHWWPTSHSDMFPQVCVFPKHISPGMRACFPSQVYTCTS